MEPDSDQSSHIQMDRCLDDVFEFKLVLAVLLVRVWFFVTIWPRNLIEASVMHFVSPSARWNVDWAQSCLNLSSTIESHLEGFSLRPWSLQPESMSCS